MIRLNLKCSTINKSWSFDTDFWQFRIKNSGKYWDILWKYGSSNIFIGRPANMACHNVCLNIKILTGIEHLLGLGANYCVKQTKLPTTTIETMMKRTRRNIRWKYIFRTYPEDDNYIPGLHINSEREPGLASTVCLGSRNKFQLLELFKPQFSK